MILSRSRGTKEMWQKEIKFFFKQERKKRFEMRKNWLHESLKIYFRLKRWLSKYNWKHISMLRRWLYGADGLKGRYRAWIECANATSTYTYSIHFVCIKQWANNSISSLTSDVSNFYCLALFCKSDFSTATLFLSSISNVRHVEIKISYEKSKH